MKKSNGLIVPDNFYTELVTEIPYLRRYARALSRSARSDEADDLVQACLERALLKVHAWQPGTNLRAWLFTILHNLFISELRRRRPLYVPMPERLSVHEAATAVRPEAYLELEAVEQALQRLPVEQREVILLVGVEGLSYEETAQVLGVPVGTVRSRLSRGRGALRALIEQPRAAFAGTA